MQFADVRLQRLNARNALRSGTTGDSGTGSNSVSLGRLRGRNDVTGNTYGLDKVRVLRS